MLEISDDSGPVDPPAARALSGLWEPSSSAYRIDVPPGSVERTPLGRGVSDVVGRMIEPGMRLRWACYPELPSTPVDGSSPEAFDASFAATAISVDLELDDGTWLSDSGAVDQAEYRIDVRSQWDSRAGIVDQWNWRTVSLDAVAGRTIVGVHLVGLGVTESFVPTGWISDIAIEDDTALTSALGSASDLVGLVDTRRGTHASGRTSRGNTMPAVAVPHGFLFGIPVTDASSMSWPYRYADRTIEAFAVSHAPSPWIGDRSVVQVMPVTDVDGDCSRAARAKSFAHAEEHAGPDRYDVRFDDGDTVSMTTTDHVLVVRADLPASTASGRRAAGLVLDQVDDRGAWTVEGDDLVVGWTDSRVERIGPTAPRMYVAVRFDRPIASVRTAPIAERAAASLALGFDAGRVEARIATSFISVDQALHTLALEAHADRTFDDLADASRASWASQLGIVRFATSNADRRGGLVSSLYRMALYPNSASENAGTAAAPEWIHADATEVAPRPHGERSTGCVVRAGRSFVNNGFWDTYRTIWPAYSLFEPDLAADMLDGFVEHFRAGGWMERWSAPGAVNCMVGTSSDVVSADAVAAGVPVTDQLGSYDAALRNATTASDREEVGRAASTRAAFLGFVPDEVPEGMSWTLESGINDHGIAHWSRALLDALPDDHLRRSELLANERWFRNRAMAYVDMFDERVGFFRGRDEAGDFGTVESFDARDWGGDNTETNAWGMAFTAPHDGNGLAALYAGSGSGGSGSAGSGGLEAKLDAYFATPETARHPGTYPQVIHEMTEARDIRMGMYGLSNQPAHHIPFMYAFTSAPWKGQAIVRESVRRLFLGSEIGQGYPGDEDNGEMSAWYVFAAIGLYPLTPGSGELVITAPSVARAEIPFGDATTTITAHGLTPETVYVQEVRVDGRLWTSQAIPIEMLRQGVAIDIDLGTTPSEWGTTPESRPFSWTAPGDRPDVVRDLLADGPVTDDDSATGVLLAAGESVECAVAGPGDGSGVSWYTVTLGAPTGTDPVGSEPGSGAGWTLEIGDGDTWRVLDEQRDVVFRWQQQTRAFLAPTAIAGGRLRFTARDALDLRQLEAFER
jgi:predicted alpha-1,2-mannosidase